MIETFFLFVLFSKGLIYLELHRGSKEMIISDEDILGRCIEVFYLCYVSGRS